MVQKSTINFIDLISIESLDLSSNCLKFIDKDAFIGLKKLKYLCLDWNEFDYLDECSFSNLDTLLLLEIFFISEHICLKINAGGINLPRHNLFYVTD